MPTIELSQQAYDRLVFLSAQIGDPMERHCAEWVEVQIRCADADSEIAESYFHELVDDGLIVPGEAFTATDLVDEDWDRARQNVELAIEYGKSTGRLRDTQDGYVLVAEDGR